MATDEERSWIQADALLAKPIRFEQLKREIDRFAAACARKYDATSWIPCEVLVTDDELGMRLGVSRTLRDFSVRVPDVNGAVTFTVDQAESGEEALEKIRRSPPDILLLDHKMPGISGLDVLDQLAGRRRHADDHDHGLRLDRDRRDRHQTRGLRFPGQAVHARRAEEHDPQGRRAVDPGQAGPATGRRKAAAFASSSSACWATS